MLLGQLARLFEGRELATRKNGTLTDTSGSGLTQQLPIAVMQGVHSGMADMHYGNNAPMMQGHHYSLDVTMRGEHAKLDLGSAQ